MQVNLSIQSFTHLFKQMFIEYLIGRSEEEEEKNQCLCVPSVGSVWWGSEKSTPYMKHHAKLYENK